MGEAKTTAETLPINASSELHEAVMLLWVAQTALGELEHSDSPMTSEGVQPLLGLVIEQLDNLEESL